MLTSKQRAYLKSLAMELDPIILLGKASLTTENEKNVDEALAKRELVKVGVLKNCDDDPREIAETLAEHTRSEVVQVIGKKIVLYRQGKDKNRKIELPKARKKQ
jgi:RNA-binding protein